MLMIYSIVFVLLMSTRDGCLVVVFQIIVICSLKCNSLRSGIFLWLLHYITRVTFFCFLVCMFFLSIHHSLWFWCVYDSYQFILHALRNCSKWLKGFSVSYLPADSTAILFSRASTTPETARDVASKKQSLQLFVVSRGNITSPPPKTYLK